MLNSFIHRVSICLLHYLLIKAPDSHKIANHLNNIRVEIKNIRHYLGVFNLNCRWLIALNGANLLPGFCDELVDFHVLAHAFHLLDRGSLGLGELRLDRVHFDPENLDSDQHEKPLCHFSHH